MRAWETAFPQLTVYQLNQNYRNTNQIVHYVSSTLDVDMQSIGFDGPEISNVTPRTLSAFFKDKKGLKALICTEEMKTQLMRKSYNDLTQKGKISRTKINVMTVYESKGLEFTSVAVAPQGMTDSERYIAFTRALNELAIIQIKK